MNRTIFLRNLFVFTVFVALLFATPFVFAGSRSVYQSIVLTENVGTGLSFYRKDSPVRRNNFDLPKGTVIQFPREVLELIKVDPNKGIDVKRLVAVWKAYGGTDTDQDGKKVPKLYGGDNPTKMPVKIVSIPGQDVPSDSAVGFININQIANDSNLYHGYGLDPISRARDGSAFAGVAESARKTHTYEEAYIDSEVVASSDDEHGSLNGAAVDATITVTEGEDLIHSAPVSAAEVLVAPEPPVKPTRRPVARDEAAAEAFLARKRAEEEARNRSVVMDHPIMNCRNNPHAYKTSRQNFANHSCLRGWSNVQRAQLIVADVNKVNEMRRGIKPNFRLDPRFSVCAAINESDMHPNALGGDNDRGTFQVTDGLGRGLLRLYKIKTPGFTSYGRNDVSAYTNKMLGSTLAQAEYHYLAAYEAAKLAPGVVARMNAGDATSEDVRQIAMRYNGGPSGPRKPYPRDVYGPKISRCYAKMVQAMTRDGRILNSNLFNQAYSAAK